MFNDTKGAVFAWGTYTLAMLAFVAFLDNDFELMMLFAQCFFCWVGLMGLLIVGMEGSK